MEFCHESSLRKIQSDAFYGCVSLTELILPDQVEEIAGMESFKYCCLTNFHVPVAMKTVNLSAFGDMNTLVSIEIPESVERIHDHYNASVLRGLRNIAFP